LPQNCMGWESPYQRFVDETVAVSLVEETTLKCVILSTTDLKTNLPA